LRHARPSGFGCGHCSRGAGSSRQCARSGNRDGCGLRAQIKRFVTAELHDDGATVCAILNAPLNDTRRGVSCTARWDTSIKASLARSGSRKQLHADIAALGSAAVSSDGIHASITTPYPLLAGHARSHFYWTDDCWMLTS
jgi:hypothetical protein